MAGVDLATLKRVSIRVPVAKAEEARAAWVEGFPEGFEERDLGDELELAAYVESVPSTLAGARVEEVEAGWEDRWRIFHRPVRVGPLWLGPPWEATPADALAVVIDPGRAFGTGAHATTRLCLELLLSLERGSLLDIGCGSGVLAIAATRLGFAPVIAVDDDPSAVEATRANAAANGVEIDIALADGLRDALPEVNTAVANIALAPVEQLAQRLRAAFFVAGGFLETDDPKLPGWRRRARRTAEGWAAHLYERE
jgi:ribosomal protein L11 methyltransferase